MIRGVGVLLLAILVAELAGPAAAVDLDRRRMLTAAEHEPWKGVGRVNVSTMDELGMCTGTLIEENLVITAAHCVVSRRTGLVQAPGNVHFVAGWRRGTKVAARRVAEIRLHPDYLVRRAENLGAGLAPGQVGKANFSEIPADLALLVLESPIPREDAPFFLIDRRFDPRDRLAIVSYRRDRPHALTRQEGCGFLGFDRDHPTVMVLSCDVTFGASGSPVFVETDGASEVVAVISAMGQGPDGQPVALAVRFDDAMIEAIWKDIADAGSRASPAPRAQKLQPLNFGRSLPTFRKPDAASGSGGN